MFEFLQSIRLTKKLDIFSRQLYREIIKCYMHETFDACCVLSRALIEFMAEKYITYKGYSKELVSENIHDKKKTIAKILMGLGMSIKTINLYRKIGEKADSVLHRVNIKGKFVSYNLDLTSEKDALWCIRQLQSFIKKFPH